MAKKYRRASRFKPEELDYVDLVEAVRRSRNNDKRELAFNEIEKRMKPKMRTLSYRFKIPGHDPSDVYQESLIALRSKAIKDYDQTRGNGTGPYPFDKFAVLCIRRHLSTKLKSSFQNKKIVLNTALSLNQDRNDDSDDNLFLSDIIADGEKTILESIEDREYQRKLFTMLIRKLSKFEREVFILYAKKNSYDQIMTRINGKRDVKNEKINVKSVDNALSRIKTKAKDIFDKHGEE